MTYLFTEEEIEHLYELEGKWGKLVEELEKFNFNYQKFQKVAIETFPYIAKFSGKEGVLPEIVTLLLSIHSFAVCKCYVNSESVAAQLVAETFCDVENYSGVTSVHGQDYTMCAEAKLDVGGPSDIYTIEPDTFDLSELIADIEKKWR